MTAVCICMTAILAGGEGGAVLSIEQARTVAESFVGHPMPSATHRVTDLEVTSYVTFEVRDDDGRWRDYGVNLTTGKFIGWVDITDSREPRQKDPVNPITREQALTKARDLATHYLGTQMAATMSFTIIDWPRSATSDEVTISAEGERRGDPPRYGLSPVCYLSLRRSTGLVKAYSQQVPDPEDPVVPQVAPERASELALAEAGKRRYRTDGVHAKGAPELRQHKGGVWWTVSFNYDAPATDGVEHLAFIAEVDALTGAVTRLDTALGVAPDHSTDSAGGAPGVPGPVPKATTDGSQGTVRGAVAGGTALLAAVLGLAAVLAHRRSRRSTASA